METEKTSSWPGQAHEPSGGRHTGKAGVAAVRGLDEGTVEGSSAHKSQPAARLRGTA